MHDIGILPSSVNSYGKGINASGQVTGYAQFSAGPRNAFFYDGSSMHDLGTLGGTVSIGNDVNDSGWVTGVSSTASGCSHAFLHDGTGMQDLGTLGGSFSTGCGINSSGWVVGYSYVTGDASNHAFVYDGQEMRDLNALIIDELNGWQYLEVANAINDSGQVTGHGYTSAGEQHAFLLTPLLGPGDITGGGVSLDDAIVSLKVVAGIDTTGLISPGYDAAEQDVDRDGMVGLAEAIFQLQVVAGLR